MFKACLPERPHFLNSSSVPENQAPVTRSDSPCCAEAAIRSNSCVCLNPAQNDPMGTVGLCRMPFSIILVALSSCSQSVSSHYWPFVLRVVGSPMNQRVALSKRQQDLIPYTLMSMSAPSWSSRPSPHPIFFCCTSQFPYSHHPGTSVNS